MTYNITNITNANDILGIVKATNTLSGYLIFGLVLMALFIVGLSGFTSVPFKQRLLGVSLVISIIAVIMWLTELVAITIVIVPLLILFISIPLYMFVD